MGRSETIRVIGTETFVPHLVGDLLGVPSPSSGVDKALCRLQFTAH